MSGDPSDGPTFTPEATRRPDVAAVPVRLADGRLWSLAAAHVRIKPRFGADGSCDVESYWGYPPTVDRSLSKLRAEQAAGEPLSNAALLSAAVGLLRAAHDVSPAEAVALFDLAAAELAGLVEALARALAGDVDTDPGPAEIGPAGGGGPTLQQPTDPGV